MEKAKYFYELSYWLLHLSKSKRISAYIPFSKNKVDDLIKKLISDIKIFGIRLPETFNPSQLRQGFGEHVCVVINDLLNKELIRRDFKFLEPRLKDIEDMEAGADENDSDDEKERVISKSINFKEQNKKD